MVPFPGRLTMVPSLGRLTIHAQGNISGQGAPAHPACKWTPSLLGSYSRRTVRLIGCCNMHRIKFAGPRPQKNMHALKFTSNSQHNNTLWHTRHISGDKPTPAKATLGYRTWTNSPSTRTDKSRTQLTSTQFEISTATKRGRSHPKMWTQK